MSDKALLRLLVGSLWFLAIIGLTIVVWVLVHAG